MIFSFRLFISNPLPKAFFFCLVVSLTWSCEKEQRKKYSPTYTKTPPKASLVHVLGVHPLHNPQKLFEVFNPLIEYLTENIPEAKFRLEASRNYASFNQKLYQGKFSFALPNPYQTINAINKGYRVFAKMGDDHNFRGIIIVRKDSGIEKPIDLKGKKVSYPAKTALAATMMPQFYLQSAGLKVEKDLENTYVGSQESSIMNVYLKQTIAGATWPPPWRAFQKAKPKVASELKVIWQTTSLPNNSLVVRNDINPELVKKVEVLLVNLHKVPKGKEILARMELSKFESATNATYNPVRAFIDDFDKKVRKIK